MSLVIRCLPLVRILLNTTTTTTAASAEAENDPSIMIRRLQSQAQLCQEYQDELEQLLMQIKRQEGGDDDATKGSLSPFLVEELSREVHQLVKVSRDGDSNGLELLALPLLVIVRETKLEWHHDKDNNNGGGDGDGDDDDSYCDISTTITTTSKFVQSSASWKTVERAARALQAYVQLLNQCCRWNTNHDNPQQQQQQQQPPPLASVMIQIVMACAMALPPSQYWNAERTLQRQQQSRLDDGQDCLLALWQLVCSCVTLAVPTCSNKDDGDDNPNHQAAAVVVTCPCLAHRIRHTMDGALVARLADTAMAAIQSASKQMTSGTTSRPEQSSLLTLQHQATNVMLALLTSVPFSELWQSIFPACFAGLYISLMRFCSLLSRSSSAATKAHHEVVCHTLQALCSLFKVSLTAKQQQQPQEPGQSNVDDASGQLWSSQSTTKTTDLLRSLARQSNQSSAQNGLATAPDDTGSSGTTTNNTTFLDQFCNRVPAPLTTLLHHLVVLSSSLATSTAFHQQVLHLYRIILVDTAACDCWPESVQETALEGCLVLWSPREDLIADEEMDGPSEKKKMNISAIAHSILDEAINKARNNGRQRCRPLVVNVVAQKATSLMQELPSLARAHRRSELMSRLHLLSGYLALAMKSKSATSELRTMLVNGGDVSKRVQQAWRHLYDVDFSGNVVNSTMRSSLITIQTNATGHEKCLPVHSPWLLYLNDDAGHSCQTLHLAENCLLNLGKALGERHGALLADSMVADLFESCVARAERQIPFTGQSHVEWLHEWIGSIRVAKKIVEGSFSEAHSNSKKKSKRSQILFEFCSSVLPIVSSAPLFDLPLREPQSNEASPTQALLGDAQVVNRSLDATRELTTSIALRGNAAFTYYLIDFVNLLFELLQDEGRRFLHPILFPLLAKVSQEQNSLIQNMASCSIERISLVTQHNGPSDMVRRNTQPIVGILIGKLRAPGGKALSRNSAFDEDLFVVMKVLSGLFRILSVSSLPVTGIELDERNNMSSCLKVVDELIERLDYHHVQLSREEDKGMALLQLLSSAVSAVSLQCEAGHCVSEIVEKKETTMPWLQLLDQFKIDSGDQVDSSSCLEQYIEESAEHADNAHFQTDRLHLVTDIEFVARVASRCCFFLSNPCLNVQCKSCDVLIQIFEFLGWATKIPKLPDESNGPTTAVLRQVHSSWTAIASRLKAITSAVTQDAEASLIINKSSASTPTISDKTNVGKKRVFLSKIFLLVQIIARAAGDFMSNRFRESVWPCLGRIIGAFARERHKAIEGQVGRKMLLLLEPGTPAFQRSNRSTSERELLVSVMKCLTAVFDHRQLGLTLTNLIPTASVMISPFLDDEPTVSSECVRALQSMLSIDADALWPQLMEMSGRKLPVCPLSITDYNSSQVLAESGERKSSLLCTFSEAAGQLLDFTDALPEQALY